MVTREGCAGARDFFLAFKEGCQNAGKKETFQRLSSWAQNNGEEALARVAGKFAGSAEAAEVDFNRMCIGPGKLTVPPYESVWRTHTRILNNRYSAAVLHSYAEVGLALDPRFNEMADFFGNELEFLYYLASLLQAHEKAGHTEVCEALAEAANRFWAEHLGHWAHDFLLALAQDAQEAVWKEWARVLDRKLSSLFEGVSLSQDMTGMEKTIAVPSANSRNCYANH